MWKKEVQKVSTNFINLKHWNIAPTSADVYNIDLKEGKFNLKNLSQDERNNLYLDYFNEDMLMIKNVNKNIIIDVGSSPFPNPCYIIRVIRIIFEEESDQFPAEYNPDWDNPLEKYIFYSYKEVEEMLIELLNKYQNYTPKNVL